MEIKAGRMVHLGYDKFWRSDEIVGLCPIENDRGPGRRTEVYVATRADPLVASRTERSILRDMIHLPREAFEAEEARELLNDLLDDLGDLTPVLRRMLLNEAQLDINAWERRISGFVSAGEDEDEDDDQEDLFEGDA